MDPPPEAPARSAEQRREALALANRVRLRRSEVWARWRELGREGAALEAARIVVDPPAFMGTCRILLLLDRIPTIGPVRAEKVMAALRIADCKTLSGLKPGKRQDLADFLNFYADAEAFHKDARKRNSERKWPIQ